MFHDGEVMLGHELGVALEDNQSFGVQPRTGEPHWFFSLPLFSKITSFLSFFF